MTPSPKKWSHHRLNFFFRIFRILFDNPFYLSLLSTILAINMCCSNRYFQHVKKSTNTVSSINSIPYQLEIHAKLSSSGILTIIMLKMKLDYCLKQIQFILNNDTTFYFNLPEHGTLKINSSCKAITNEQILIPHRIVQSSCEHLILDLPGITHDLRKLPNIPVSKLKKLDTKSLGNIIKDTKLTIREQDNFYNTLSNYSWHFSLFHIILTLLIL